MPAPPADRLPRTIHFPVLVQPDEEAVVVIGPESRAATRLTSGRTSSPDLGGIAARLWQ